MLQKGNIIINVIFLRCRRQKIGIYRGELFIKLISKIVVHHSPEIKLVALVLRVLNLNLKIINDFIKGVLIDIIITH